VLSILDETICMKWFVYSILFQCCYISARVVLNNTDTIPSKYDSSLLQLLYSQESTEADAVLLNEQERGIASAIVSPLNGEKDVFLQMATFQFSALRYRYRGYDAALSGTLINGLLLNDLLQGNPSWSLWNGLSQVMRNSIDFTANRFQDNWMGDVGITSITDMRALAQRKQLQWGYALSNRTYTNRYHISYATEINRKGWSWAMAANVRLATESYRTGCEYQSAAYYAAIDKQFSKAGLLSLIIFGNAQQYGKQAAVTAPVTGLLGINYNPNWGYQNGHKRNAAVAAQHIPVAILSYEWNPDNHSTWVTSIGAVMGKRTDTGLDWYQAADPRPDYYRYLPFYQTDSLLQIQVRDVWLANKDVQQINWQQLYTVNRHSFERIDNANGTGKTISGKRAHYLLEQRATDIRRWLMSSYYHARWRNNWNIAAGFQFSHQQNHYYKTVYDLLGADFHVNWNQFAENDFSLHQEGIQFDIDQPNRILRKGDKYGYDYLSSVMLNSVWAQTEYVTKKIDWLFGFRFSKTEFNRKGLVRNGLFPRHSKGTSVANHFFDPLLKLSVLFKLHPKHMISLFFQSQTKAPLFDNVYIAPKMRDTRQDRPLSEKIVNIEMVYRWVMHRVKARINLYYTTSRDGMNVLTFYHDGYRNFVNYAIENINRQYTGLESAMSWEMNERWEFSMAYAKAFNTFNSRQFVTVSLDNNEALLNKMEVYSKNFRIAGSPQQVGGIALRYHTPKHFFLQTNASFFKDQWLEFNPVRRTYEALEGIQKGTEQWHKIIDQTRLPSAMLVNMFMGKGFSVRNVYHKKPLRFFCTVSINNLLNQKQIITGGYEQLRFDQDTKNPDRFPPKLFYGYGLNYALSVSLSF